MSLALKIKYFKILFTKRPVKQEFLLHEIQNIEYIYTAYKNFCARISVHRRRILGTINVNAINEKQT
jgi:hypothetical protein